MKKIYLVDDDEDDRMLARQALESVGEEVEIVDLMDGNELLILLEEALPTDPVLVLMDMNMPVMNGIEALSALKSRADLRHIPVVLFSTSENPNLVKQAYQLGANAYIVKPYTLDGYIRIAHAINLCFLNSYRPGGHAGLRKITGKNIVLIEDNSDHAALIELFMKNGAPGLNVIHQTSAESAIIFFQSLDKKASAAIDLIILDLYLPTRKQGLDLLAWLRTSYMDQGIPIAPVIVLSSSPHHLDIQASYRHHANAYLVKTAEPTRSFSYLTDLCSVWWDTISFPNRPVNGIA
ncbi:response regulator [Dyadobacter psychrophilus]|uniref:CheY chemotaxis protein or a CheY-like REC (Receiver) domain n=1 Tax=Dyadobacter psychrophilus TaxID=651661 RepID=A0A1T5HBJ7_9BACT|nr:response regulator [Dyadobacter psychrophilus]SKC18024.1 CheY chemotaxis protein or a CheY-like REC (receiver) domain [Dyadobacter psychrophilus]